MAKWSKALKSHYTWGVIWSAQRAFRPLITPNRDSNPDLPVIGNPVYYESDALDHSVTAAGLTELINCQGLPVRRNVSIYNQAVKLRLETKGIVSCLTEITTSRTYQRYIRNGEETTDCGGYGLHENLAHAIQLCLLVEWYHNPRSGYLDASGTIQVHGTIVRVLQHSA
uniref:DUF5636 domain-containing protein n=1 Tax=Timema monikensis TaxID=170555 RepID=A0A7R9E3D3_9NEOP|nr:unnamed protein product [Timema monikensis]